MDMNTLSYTHPLTSFTARFTKRFTSPLQRIAASHEGIPHDSIETIQHFALGPWEERVAQIQDKDSIMDLMRVKEQDHTVIVTSTAVRNDAIGIGATIRYPWSRRPPKRKPAEEPETLTGNVRVAANGAVYIKQHDVQSRGKTASVMRVKERSSNRDDVVKEPYFRAYDDFGKIRSREEQLREEFEHTDALKHVSDIPTASFLHD
jgi:hypothetical protein